MLRKILICVALLSIGKFAQAAETNFGVVSIENRTNTNITFFLRWDAAGQGWQEYVLAPGQGRHFWWTYAYQGQNRSPACYVRFDCDSGPGISWDEESLQPYACGDTSETDAHQFCFVEGGQGFQIISLN